MDDPRQQKTAIDEKDWVLGPLAAPVTILEYGDLECPFCAATRPELEAVVAGSRQHVRLVFRHFPIHSLHPHAVDAAEIAEAAGARGRFWEMHDLIYEHQDAMDVPHLLGLAASLDLPDAEIARELRAHLHEPAVKEDFRRGLVDGVNGTPTLFIDGVRYDGERDRESLFDAIAQVSGIAPQLSL